MLKRLVELKPSVGEQKQKLVYPLLILLLNFVGLGLINFLIGSLGVLGLLLLDTHQFAEKCRWRSDNSFSFGAHLRVLVVGIRERVDSVIVSALRVLRLFNQFLKTEPFACPARGRPDNLR